MTCKKEMFKWVFVAKDSWVQPGESINNCRTLSSWGSPYYTWVRQSHYKCCRCSVLWLTALDRPSICKTLDIRLVVKSEEIGMIVKPILIKADAVPQAPTVFHFFKALLSISSLSSRRSLLYFSLSYPFSLPSFSPCAPWMCALCVQALG